MDDNKVKTHLILGITGGSGAPIAKKLVELITSNNNIELSLIISDHAKEVFRAESGMDLGHSHKELSQAIQFYFPNAKNLNLVDSSNMAAQISSGSQMNSGMIIAPCSMSTLGCIANGITTNLIHRAASVMLKEKRNLILVTRESPLSPIHLKNMLELSSLGVHVVPPTLAFYTQPKSMDDAILFVCMKILDLAGIPHNLDYRWKGQDKSGNESYSGIHRYLG